MQGSRWLSAVWLLAGAASLSLICPLVRAAKPVDMAAMVPAKPLVYIHWAGAPSKWTGYRQSRFNAFLAKSRLSELFTRQMPELIQHVAIGHPKTARQMAQALIDSNLFYQHPFAFYLSDFRYNPKNIDLPPIGLHIEFLMRAGKDAPVVLNEFRNWAKMLNNTGSHKPSPALRVMAGKVGGTVYLAAGMTPQMRALLTNASAATVPGTLRGSKAYHAVLRQTQKMSVLRVYADVHAILALVNDTVGHAPDVTPEQRKMLAAIENILNLQSYTRLTMAAGFSGRRWLQTMYLGKNGSTVDVGQQARVQRLLGLVPSGCVNFSIDELNLRQIGNLAFKIATAAHQSKQLNQGLAMVRAFTGLDIRHDVINALGADWLVYRSPYVPMLGRNGIMMVNRLRHPRRFAQSLVTVLPIILMGANAAYHKAHMNAPALRLQHTKVGTNVIYYLTTPTLMPAWAQVGRNFYFAFYPRTIQMALQHAAGTASIATSAKFQDVMRRLGSAEGLRSIAYADSSALAPEGYMEWQLAARAVPLLTGIKLHPKLTALLPSLDNIETILTPAGSINWVDKTGIHSRAISAFPGSSLLTPQSVSSAGLEAVAPLGAAIMLPSLARAKMMANRAVTEANERQIIMLSMEYAQNHHGKLPEDIAGILSVDNQPSMWVAAGSSTKPVKKIRIKSLSAAKVDALLATHSDFLYVGNGANSNRLQDATNFVLVYSRFMVGSGGRIVGFADGVVEWMKPAAFQACVTRNNLIRQKLHLPLIQIRHGH